jgi:hypothetical protein
LQKVLKGGVETGKWAEASEKETSKKTRSTRRIDNYPKSIDDSSGDVTENEKNNKEEERVDKKYNEDCYEQTEAELVVECSCCENQMPSHETLQLQEL